MGWLLMQAEKKEENRTAVGMRQGDEREQRWYTARWATAAAGAACVHRHCGWVRRHASALLAVMVAVMMVSTGEGVAEGEGVKCFEGEVTYCGINADGGAIPAKGKKYYAEGMNWACSDQLSNLDPTNIAPNCWDQASCEALQTSDIDSPFEIEHSSPYNYIADEGILAKKRDSSSNKTCPADHPACGLQTTLREAKGKCKGGCKTRFRYTADIGAIYWSVFQVKKECLAAGEECKEAGCWCTTESPYYTGAKFNDPDDGMPDPNENDAAYCSPWARAACRRKAYKCMHYPADYVVTAFQDYDIRFCSMGSDEEECSGCVACTDVSCLKPVVHVSKLLSEPPANLSLDATYNCSLEKCGGADGGGARTCWNKTCAYSDDCYPECEAVYQSTRPGAGMGFYVSSSKKPKLVERVRCCDKDFCNFPNSAARMSPALPLALSLAVAAAMVLS